jgi:hypothetical protein
MRAIAVLVCVVAALVAAGCAGASSDAGGNNVLRGGIRYFGGSGGLDGQGKQGEHFEPGTVKLYRGQKKIATDKVKDGERFSFRVKPGTYRLRADLGDLPCERTVRVAKPVVVADLECSIK